MHVDELLYMYEGKEVTITFNFVVLYSGPVKNVPCDYPSLMQRKVKSFDAVEEGHIVIDLEDESES